ncbi:hypothetical protein QQ045_016058 [Rhodiola kirilowii]
MLRGALEFYYLYVQYFVMQMHPTKALGMNGYSALFYQKFWSLVKGDVVSNSQAALVSGRLITDNILLAHETMHYINHMKMGHVGFLSLKIDMSKAYNRVEWRFLEKMLLKLGFEESWVRLVMFYVSTVSYRQGRSQEFKVTRAGS